MYNKDCIKISLLSLIIALYDRNWQDIDIVYDHQLHVGVEPHETSLVPGGQSPPCDTTVSLSRQADRRQDLQKVGRIWLK